MAEARHLAALSLVAAAAAATIYNLMRATACRTACMQQKQLLKYDTVFDLTHATAAAAATAA
jgi:hypothetical protein